MLAHRHEPVALDIGRGVLAACPDLEPEVAALYADIVFSCVSEAVRRTLEAEMNLANYEVRSPYLRELKARAVAEGHAEGHAEGRRQALTTAVLSVLGARGLAIDDAERTAIESCTDVDRLQRWLVLAVTAASTAEMLRA